MRVVNMYVEVNPEICTGCRFCEKVCPTLSIKVVGEKKEKRAVVDLSTCVGCGACVEICDFEGAVTLKTLEATKVISVDPSSIDEKEISKLCFEAKIHPEQIVCFCTGTRADEVAATILLGATSPEEISRKTGVRTGCKVECIEPILRLLQAAGIEPTPIEKGWQWYGITPTIWDIPEEVTQKYSARGFYFEEDKALFKKLLDSVKVGGE
ncbi:MAG: 4Fe-4S binding protein [Promethearchaeota archaeon]